MRALALALGLAAVSAFGSLPEPPTAPIARAAEPPLDLGEDIAAFYRDRGFRPLWVERSALRPEAGRLLAMLAGAGRRDSELAAAVRAAGNGDPRALTRADLLLTRAFADYVRDHHRPGPAGAMRYIDAGLAPAEPDVREALEAAAAAPSLAAHLAATEQINPALGGLRRGLAVYRGKWSRLPQLTIPAAGSAQRQALLRRRLGLGPRAPERALAARLAEFQRVHGLAVTGAADSATTAALNAGAAHYERLILANIERARAIPPRPLGRYLLVDTASARLWMIEDGRIRDSMRVIVGKSGMATPVMAGLIRYAVLNPYWNLPPDLIRERARKVVRRGPGAIAAERLQILSDWSPRARPLSPRQVNWRAVAAGRAFVNLRQRPGPHNMMGAVKFMMPNDLGVYLHDTPSRHFFARADRRISSGCVRLEDAPRLARWLFRGRPPRPSGAAEQRVDLPEPVPVYITYLTALPTREGIVFQPDSYGRDRTLLARLARRASPPRS
ncbi:MAG TPA: L,D-transpeptidase family protein [Allosphingosinicella sp.]|nr:L,D-transpeptidase family protein [Allosphingosinicella sp.]